MQDQISNFLIAPLGRGLIGAVGLAMLILGMRQIRSGRNIVRDNTVYVKDKDRGALIRGRFATKIGWLQIGRGVLTIAIGIVSLVLAVLSPQLLELGKD